jgi:hypothetical protein
LTAAGGELSGIFMEKFGGDIGSVVTEKGGAIVGAIKNYVSEIKKPGMDEALAKLNAADFKVDVDKGDGKTHIARKAFLAFQKNLAKVQPDLVNSLTKGQKIFVEDYLQKHGGIGNAFKPDQTVSISAAKIEEAMQKALNLTGSEMKHLDGMLAQPEFRISPEVSNWMNDLSSPVSEVNDLHLDQMVSGAGSYAEVGVGEYNGVNGALVAEANNVVSAPEDLTQKVPESVPEKENSQIWKYLASSLVIGGGAYGIYQYAQYKNRKDEEFKTVKGLGSASKESEEVNDGSDEEIKTSTASDFDATGEYEYPKVTEVLGNNKEVEPEDKRFHERLKEIFKNVIGSKNLKTDSRRARPRFKKIFGEAIKILGDDVELLKGFSIKFESKKVSAKDEKDKGVSFNGKERFIVVHLNKFDKDRFVEVLQEAVNSAR